MTRRFAEFFSAKEFATCGGWRSYSERILPKSSALSGLDLEQPTFNNGDLRGLSAPKVHLKKLRETPRQLRYSAVKMRALSN